MYWKIFDYLIVIRLLLVFRKKIPKKHRSPIRYLPTWLSPLDSGDLFRGFHLNIFVTYTYYVYQYLINILEIAFISVYETQN